MKNQMKKTLVFILVTVLSVSLFSGCGKKQEKTTSSGNVGWSDMVPGGHKTEETETTTEATEETTEETTEATTEEQVVDEGLVVYLESITGDYLPYESTLQADLDVCEMVFTKLLNTDREGEVVTMGKTGETRTYEGVDYTYYGPADVIYSKNEDGSAECDINLRDDICFSDGWKMTADDVIFSLYVLMDPSYDGPLSWRHSGVRGLTDYLQDDMVKSISGIQKTDEFSVHISFEYYDTGFFGKMFFAVLPMHYYGDSNAFSLEDENYGFEKGNISGIRAKAGVPLGAGPYAYEAFEDGKITLVANEYYYLGVPDIKKITIKSLPNQELLEGLADGTVNIVDFEYSVGTEATLRSYNSNGEISGDRVVSYLTETIGYGYIGMSANVIKVGEDPGSYESKCLRKALATVLALYRDYAVTAYYGDTAHVINYPVTDASWAAPKQEDAGYKVAFSEDINGNPIYTEGMTEEEKTQAALSAALEYLSAAGYTVEEGRVTAAPEGAPMSFALWFIGDGVGAHAAVYILEKATPAFESIGITLVGNDPPDNTLIWTAINTEEAAIWCAAWGAGNPDPYSSYYSGTYGDYAPGQSNSYFDVADEELDKLIMSGWQSSDHAYKKGVYKQCYDIIFDWAVEIPFYQRQSVLCVSNDKLDMSTFPQGLNGYYKWYREVQNIKCN